jgi:hypothetical protein
MKTIGLMLALLMFSGMFSGVCQAKAKRSHKLPQGVNLQTDIKFGGSTLHGQYQTPAEALAKVEDEKNLNDLLIPRTQFKDRMYFETEGSK